MRVHPYGDRAVLLSFDEPAEVMRWALALERHPPDGLIDVVPGASTIVVIGDPDLTDASRLASALSQERPLLDAEAGRPSPVDIPVVYDGEDLDEVATMTGLARSEVVATHRDAVFEVAFCGFSPGFAYLVGLPRDLHLPRRRTPRPRVPAGSVAIADRYSAVYPTDSPGGWWLLGTTDVPLWDPRRDPPSLLIPGRRVRFVEAT